MNKIVITNQNHRYEEFNEDQYIMYQCHRDPETKRFIYSEFIIHKYIFYICETQRTYLPDLENPSTINIINTPKNVYKMNSSVILFVFSNRSSSNKWII